MYMDSTRTDESRDVPRAADTKLIIGCAAAVLFVLIVAVMVVSADRQPERVITRVQTAKSPSNTADGNTTASNVFYRDGSNGKKGFELAYAPGWNISDHSSGHDGLWVEIKNGSASAVINQEAGVNSRCAYPQNGEPDPASDEKTEAFAGYTQVVTRTGEQMRIASQKDYKETSYVCELVQGPTGQNYVENTSIGQITYTDVEMDPQKLKEFAEMIKRMRILLYRI
jgi:hypothetical protein